MGDTTNESEILRGLQELGIGNNSSANEDKNSVNSEKWGSEPPNSANEENANENKNSVNSETFGSEPPNSANENKNSVNSETFGSEPPESSKTTPTGANESGQVVQQGEEQAAEEEEPFYLGDTIVIKSTYYGMTEGTIYYLDEDLLRIQPDGAPNRLVDFSIIDGGFDEEYGVQAWNFETGPRTSFVELQRFRKEQLIDGFKEGKPNGQFKITDINEERDAIQVIQVQKDPETGAVEEISDERWIVFDFVGIPLEEDMDVFQISVVPEKEQSQTIEELQAEEEKVDENAESVFEYEVLGELQTPPQALYVEIPESERYIPDQVQMSEMFAELLTDIPLTSRRSYMSLKRTRVFVESANRLKNGVLDVTPDGMIKGEQRISLTTLSDTLRERAVPLIRPVLKTRRVLLNGISADMEENGDQWRLMPILHVLEGTEQLTTTYQFATEQKEAGLPRWYQYWQRLFKQYPLGDEFTGTGYAFQKDGEFFRWEIPGETVDGLIKTGEKTPFTAKDKAMFYGADMRAFLQQIPHSLRRGLGPTFRAGSQGVELVFSSDKAPVDAYILFPYTLALSGFLGATRTGKLWDDILRSSAHKQWMSQILEEFGGVTEEADAQKIIALGASSATLANISFTDYLQMLLANTVLRGLGDISTLIADLGAEDRELNTEQMRVVQERILQVLASIRKAITAMRQEGESPKFVANLLNDFSFTQGMIDAFKRIEGEGLLELYGQFTKRIPKYANNDIGIFAFFMTYAPDYFLAILGGDDARIRNELTKYRRTGILRRFHDMYALRKLKRLESRKPTVNPCPHVKQLALIQKTKYTPDRMRLLNKFFRDYKAIDEDTVDNWFMCRKCDQPLICRHEVLQIQQVLKPQEYNVIQKEIVLSFAGGRFGSLNICRNCGKPISELDYDKNVEFDDEGRPMMGRSELVDKDAQDTEELLLILNMPVETEEEKIKFETPQKEELYAILREIVQRLGITPEKPDIVSLIDTAALFAAKLPSQEAFKKIVGDKKKGGEYQSYVSRLKVSLVASLLLVHIQTKIPDYQPRSFAEGCRPGFLGWPLLEVEAANKDDLVKQLSTESAAGVGVQYLACVLASIQIQRPPWTTTKWLQEKSEQGRIKRILVDITSYINANLVTNAEIQTKLQEKRAFLQDQFGKDAMKAKHSEKIPDNFLPHMEPIEEVVMAEGAARNDRGNLLRSVGFIRALHAFAKERTKVVANSPFAEAICCSTTISEWDAYWKEASAALPTLPERLVVRKPLARDRWSVVPFFPPPTKPTDTQLPEELGYQLFLRVCYDGPRVGLPHELGFDGKCDWCGIEIPLEYIFPDRDNEGTILYNEEAIFTALTNVPWQGQENLQKLLDISNRRSIFQPYRVPVPSKDMDFFRSLGLIQEDLVPVEEWSTLIQEVATNLDTLRTASYTDLELSLALQELANTYTTRPEDKLQKNAENYKADMILYETLSSDGYKGESYYAILQHFASEEPSILIECLRTYLVTPIRRVLSQYQRSTIQTIRKDFDLERQHNDVLETMFERHSGFIEHFQGETARVNVPKCEHYLEQMSVFLETVTELRSSRLPFGAVLLKLLLKVFLLCPLADLLNPDVQVEVATGSEDADTTLNDVQTIELVKACIQKYAEERQVFLPTDIKSRMAKAKEREVNRFIDRFDKLSDEEKKIELMKKRLGLGEWSIGGTKLVYQYDKDQWKKNFTQYGRDVGLPPDMGGDDRAGVGMFAEGEFGGVEDGGARDGDGYGDELGARADSDD